MGEKRHSHGGEEVEPREGWGLTASHGGVQLPS